MGLPQLWQYFHKMDGNVCLQWTVPHPARPDNQFKQVGWPVSTQARDVFLFQWAPAAPSCAPVLPAQGVETCVTLSPPRPSPAVAVHEQRLCGRAKGPLQQLWLRQERGAFGAATSCTRRAVLHAARRGEGAEWIDTLRRQ